MNFTVLMVIFCVAGREIRRKCFLFWHYAKNIWMPRVCFHFYSNDHEPVHCHVKKGDKEVWMEFIFEKGRLVNVSIRKYKNSKRVLTSTEREKIRKFAASYYKEIAAKWDDFRADKEIKFEKITRSKNDDNE